jgi:glutathione synthase/RimK-type ligase-like ATP-grasp enzyme
MNADRITLATCDHLPEPTASDQALARALQARGAQVVGLPWSSISEDAPADLIVLRSTWDYHKRIDEFRDWLDRMERAGKRIVNPPETVRWNLDKAYLLELEAAGIAIPRTTMLDGATPETIHGVMEEAGWTNAVLKPRVSATAHGTFRIRANDVEWHKQLAETRQAGSLIQEYVTEITTRGELSLLFFDGQFSHAAIKRPKSGDFRVQTDFGGTAETTTPSRAAIEFAERVLAAQPAEWLYARVDLVEASRGPLLMELELIEPHLFFDLVPDAAGRLADPLLRLVS